MKEGMHANRILVMAGLVPAIPMRDAHYAPKRDARVKPAHDNRCILVIASKAKQSIVPSKERMDCFASLAMTGVQIKASAL